jgi:nitrogen fixation NifU-like protein
MDLDFILDHYDMPRNHGAFADADVVQAGGVPDCGDLVTIYLKIDPETERVMRYAFEGEGCTISQAAASVLGELATSMTLTEIEAFDATTMMELLGRDLVRSRPRCATLAVNTLKRAVAAWRAQGR